MKNKKHITLLLAACIGVAGCSTVRAPSPADPLEGFNRTVFQFNDDLDRYAMKPVAQGYKFVLPTPVRASVTNFFSNLGDVDNLANNLLQANVTAATQDLMRIAINSVFGVGGLFDFATPAGLPKHNQDFGVTLGKWGLPAGPYLVLPLFGPSTIRDTVGTVADLQIDPSGYFKPIWFRNTLYGLRVVNTRANYLGATSLLSQAALDKYSFTRDAYLQRRQYLIKGSSASEQNLPNYDDESGPTSAGPAAPAAPASASEPASEAAPTSAPAPAGASAPAAEPSGNGNGTNNDNAMPVPNRQMVPNSLRLFR